MIQSTTTPSSVELPPEHPAKPIEEALRSLAPLIAQGLFAWATRPPRPPFTIRLVRRLGDRLTRSGRALRAFANAYVHEADSTIVIAPPIAERPMPAPPASSAKANGVSSPAPGGLS